MSALTGVLFLIAICFSTTSFGQTLQELQTHYDSQSPLPRERLNTAQTVDPNKSYMTKAEEDLAEFKAKNEADKNALDEKLYLDTDYRFFQSLNVVTLEEDELDKAYKESQMLKTMTELKGTDQTVKSELKTTTPQTRLLSPKEASAADARRDNILKKIASNVQAVKTCILQNRKDKEAFKGTELTLAWQVENSGKVSEAKVKATDVESKAIQDCIVKALMEWNFGDVVGDQKVAAKIEYTYRFTNPAKKDVAAQNPVRSPSQE